MVLDAERSEARRFEPFARAVVQMQVRGVGDAAQRLDIDDEAVILRRDLDAPRLQILHRLIETPVAELQLVGVATEREREELVPEADAEKGACAEQLAGRRQRGGPGRRG